jgi:hypothetical protein
MVREKVLNTVNILKEIFPHVIIIGHRKWAKAVVDSKAIVEPESLDLTGKLKNMLMADCDAIGYVYRDDEKGKLMVSFQANEALEVGRFVHRAQVKISFVCRMITHRIS